jgi:dienelactone hydrolase
VLPDILSGEQLPLNVFELDGFDVQDWAAKHGPDVVDPIVRETIDYIHKTLGIDKIAAVGYCFGGKYVARFLRPGQIDSGYTAHPSYIAEEELAGIKGPFSIAASGK